MKIGARDRGAAIELEGLRVSVTIEADWICGECLGRPRRVHN